MYFLNYLSKLSLIQIKSQEYTFILTFPCPNSKLTAKISHFRVYYIIALLWYNFLDLRSRPANILIKRDRSSASIEQKPQGGSPSLVTVAELVAAANLNISFLISQCLNDRGVGRYRWHGCEGRSRQWGDDALLSIIFITLDAVRCWIKAFASELIDRIWPLNETAIYLSVLTLTFGSS